MREIILNVEEEGMTKKGQVNKLMSMLQYTDAFIYLTALQENYSPAKDNKTEDQIEVL